jgi:hypothetical protein
MAKKKPMTVAEQLRQAIKDSGKSHYAIAKLASELTPDQPELAPDIIDRFVRGDREIRSETFSRIAAALDLELRKRG